MPNVPPPPISARMTATGGKHRPEKPLRKLPQLAKSSREDQPCRSLRKLPVNQSHESPSPLHKSIRKFVHAPLYASTDTPVTEPSPARSGGSPSISLRARAASREARDANVFKRGRLLRNAEQVAGEQSEKLRGAVPWLEDTDIPSDWDQANRFRMRATKAIHDHDMQPRTGLVDELERRLEQAERAEGEKPSPEQVKALALRMAEQRERAAEDPTQDMNRPEPSGDELLDLSEPEDLGESGPFEERSAPRTKADLLREIRQRADRRTGQQEAEQRQIDPWQVQPPQRRGHGR